MVYSIEENGMWLSQEKHIAGRVFRTPVVTAISTIIRKQIAFPSGYTIYYYHATSRSYPLQARSLFYFCSLLELSALNIYIHLCFLYVFETSSYHAVSRKIYIANDFNFKYALLCISKFLHNIRYELISSVTNGQIK